MRCYTDCIDRTSVHPIPQSYPLELPYSTTFISCSQPISLSFYTHFTLFIIRTTYYRLFKFYWNALPINFSLAFISTCPPIPPSNQSYF